MHPRSLSSRTILLWTLGCLVLSPRSAESGTGTVEDAQGQVIRAQSVSGWVESSPHSARDCAPGHANAARGAVSRSSSGDGYTVDACGAVHGKQPRQASTTTLGLPEATGLAGATIDSMTCAYSFESNPSQPALVVLGSAQTYFLSDGTNWPSGAGSLNPSKTSFDHAEVVGSVVRYYLRPPSAHVVYQQTDFNFGQHSSQGTLESDDPLLLEAEIGSNRAVLRGKATIVSNDATFYGDLFNYFSAPVGATVPFEVVYTLSGGTWTVDTFQSQFSYSLSGRVWFTRPVSDSPLVELTITGPAEVSGVSTFRYHAIARHEDAILEDVSQLAAWTVEPGALATVDHGLLTTQPLAAPEATLTLRAEFAVAGTSRSAEQSVLYRQGPPEEAGTDWPMFQANSRHNGYRAVDLNATDFHFRWQLDLAPGFTLNPVTASEGRVFCSVVTYFQDMTTLWALDARTGQQFWSKGFGDIFSVNPPSVGLGKVFIQTCSNYGNTWLHAFDAATGAVVFKSPHGAQWERYFAPTIFHGNVYVDGGSYGGMYAFDGTNGAQLWFTGLQQYDQWTPAVDEQFAYAYVGSYQPGLYVLDRATGDLDHFTPDLQFEWDGWSMNVAPVLGNASDVIAIHDGRLINFDLTGEEIRWQKAAAFHGQPSVEGGAIYALDDGRLSARNEGTGDELWNWTSPGTGLSSNIILTRTHILVSSPDHVYAIDRSSHAAVWDYDAGGQLALADGMLFVASADGRLTAFEVAPEIVLHANAGADVVAECAAVGEAGTAVRLDGSGSTGIGLTYAWSAPGITFDDPTSATPTGRFPFGSTDVSLVVSAGGLTSSDIVQVRVVDTVAPTIVVTSDTPILWPPDHQLVPVHFSVQSDDACDGHPTIRLLSVSSNEPDAGTGSDDISLDVQNMMVGAADFDVVLRAERSAGGPGRTYDVCFEASDATGNTSTGCTQVLVPHDQRGEGRLAASGSGWTATLLGSLQFLAPELDPVSLRVVRAGGTPLHWDGTPVSLADVNDDRREDATVSLVADIAGPNGSDGIAGVSFAVWTAPDGICATPLETNAVTAVGDDVDPGLAFSAALLRNPGLGSTAIRYTIPAAGRVQCSVWDVSGRLVGRLVDRDEVAGVHDLRFAPRQQRGTQLYFYRIDWAGQSRTGRFTLIR